MHSYGFSEGRSSSANAKAVTDNLQIRIYVNKMENRIILKIKNRYYLLMPETMELLGSAKKKITKDKNGKDVLLLKYN